MIQEVSMQAKSSGAGEHQLVFCGLEVLRLIGERAETRDEIDQEDLRLVLQFMTDVAHPCLAIPEEWLGPVESHQHVVALFDKLSKVAADGAYDQMGSLCRDYSALVAGLICQERNAVQGSFDVPKFYDREREVHRIAQRHSRMLHRLESKYTSPHCI
jgi:hypothetical protein